MLSSRVSPAVASPTLEDASFVPRSSKRNGIHFGSEALPIPSYSPTVIVAPTLTYQSEVSLPLSPPATSSNASAFNDRLPSDFDVKRLPAQNQMNTAMSCRVLDVNGESLEFSQLLDRKYRTIVIFIRNFRCAFCQAYIENLSTIINHQEERGVVSSAGIKVVIIGLGSHNLIRKYRALFDCPYPIYSDASASNKLYRALGMTRRSIESGPEASKGDYLNHLSPLQLMKYGIKNCLRLPAFISSGDLKQLGGELIFEPVPVRKTSRVAFKVMALPDPTNSVSRPLQETNLSGKVSLSLNKSLTFNVDKGDLSRPHLPEDHRERMRSPKVEIHCKYVHRMSNLGFGRFIHLLVFLHSGGFLVIWILSPYLLLSMKKLYNSTFCSQLRMYIFISCKHLVT
ncbi:hypothetical protein CROQUDRAFT_723512 [Cronartium quercuum f. sp. fusiforme G11]|uniref:Uncharacterized protein n=1 Tax=Cronartium quercuum f. sp. fusiforme G11 TaxID=708437 RepID=A0A9P6TB44_9BASI|nr:hypothetical protein CROQUDRAFT_723512 [Cronartium quercuum f. sp. fusiforme G11]